MVNEILIRGIIELALAGGLYSIRAQSKSPHIIMLSTILIVVLGLAAVYDILRGLAIF